ncbi:MAG: ABC transporter permease subunit, partial [Synergistes sp.]|nr:ABC transporter permease subunit [Synergistes sp.]
LPSALPSILTGLRLGLGYSWRSLVAAELVAASSGLGYMILDAEQLSRSDTVLMGILVIGVLGVLLDWLCVFVSRAAKAGR